MDWNTFREQFPAVHARTYLNTAGGGAMSRRAARAGKAYYDEAVAGADVPWNAWLERSDAVRASVAHFIGGRPEGVAFLQNASLALNIVARLFESPVDIVAIDREFPSCTTPWLRAGHRVRFIATPADGAVTAEMVERALAPETAAFVLSSVQFANGYRADLGAIGEVCRSRGVRFVVDATQSICAYDLHVERERIDALVFSGYKWAVAGYGIAVLHLAPDLLDRAPPLFGWRSARVPYLLENDRIDPAGSAVAHELGHPAFPGIFTLGASLELFVEAGRAAVSARIDGLAERLRIRLLSAGFELLSSRAPGTTSGIVLANVGDASLVCAALEKRRVYTSARSGGLRVSVHAYNNESDVDQLIEALEEVRRDGM